MKLTPANVRALQPGQSLKCDKVRGLQLRCQRQAKTWSLYYRAADGSQRRPSIGRYPDMNIDDARAAARVLLRQVAAGEDPSAARQQLRGEMTVAQLCDRYVEQWVPRKKSGADDVRLIDRVVRPQWGSRKLSSIHRRDVAGLVRDMYERKFTSRGKFFRGQTDKPSPYAANALRALLSKMFSFAIVELECTPPTFVHPVKGTEKYKTRARRRKASPAEMEAIGQAIRAELSARPSHCAALLCLFATGGRVNEIVKARRDELAGNVLRKFDHKTDGHVDEREIIIPQSAMHMIAALPRTSSPYLFGNIGMKGFWRDIRNAAGCPDLQLRDARRTFASLAKDAGVSLDQIGELFGHTSTQTTRGYAWLYDDTKQAVAENVGGSVFGLITGASAETNATQQKTFKRQRRVSKQSR